ncbi:MAG TPA: YoaK family protein [Acidobacteriaceae bacterium]|nr:YoaK family protein [Acidobacteriaceae bacterium]
MTTNITPESSTLSDALILASTGGVLDAFVYLNHGHVFANSMTGNVALLGITLLSHRWREVVPHLMPILGFFAGVISARYLHTRNNRAAIIALTLEILALFVLGWVPSGFPDIPFTAIVAYVAAFQVSSFRRVYQLPFNSTFITGNLRQAAEGLYDALDPSATPDTREKGLAQGVNLGLICLCFLAGAFLGAWAAPRLANRSLWLTEPLLVFVALRILRRAAKLKSLDVAAANADPSK